MSGLGLILSGGGARGAYEVGVLEYIFNEFSDRAGEAPSVDLISGTSVGAVNGAFVASMIHDIPGGIGNLVSVWTGLELAHVLGFGLRQAAGLYRVLLGGTGRATGVFDPSPLSALVGRNVKWRKLRQNIERDGEVVTEADLGTYAEALARNSFFGPDSYYMNHDANHAYAMSAPGEGRLSMPVLFLHGAAFKAQTKNQAILLTVSGLAVLLAGAVTPASFMQHFIVFVLAIFVGFQVIWGVAHSLHTPLMAITNAISSIIILGALMQIGSGSFLVILLAALSVFMAGINIFGGFLVTRRMLAMFQKS